MTLRVRTNRTGTINGTYSNNAGWVSGGWAPYSKSRPSLAERVTDDVAPDDNHIFSVERHGVTKGVANLVWNVDGDPAKQFTFSSMPLFEPFTESSLWDGSRSYSLSPLSNGAYATRLMARTNPNRADVDLPVFLFELKDLPEMFHLAGKTLFKKIAKANLAYNFAWKPLVSDLISLISFHDNVERRYRELKKLYSKGLRRTVELDRYSTYRFDSGGGALINVPYGVAVTAGLGVNHLTETIRGHIKWKPDGLPPKGNSAMRDLAMKAALGLYANPAAAWEVIPFSWLSDWFLDIGSYLNASRNFIPCHVTDLSIMRHTRNDFTFKPGVYWSSYVQPSYIVSQNVEDIVGFHEVKSRTPTAAVPIVDAHLPWLSPSQWSILGSLYVSKKR